MIQHLESSVEFSLFTVSLLTLILLERRTGTQTNREVVTREVVSRVRERDSILKRRGVRHGLTSSSSSSSS